MVDTPKAVTVDNFAEAEVDARIFRFIAEGGMNRGLVYEVPTPTDNQAVPRMNRDTLYAGIPIDTSRGYSITVPEHREDRYVSVYVLDNEHMTLHILTGSGVTHTFEHQEATRYVVAIPRVQLFDQADPADTAEALAILRTVRVESGSAEPKPMVDWDWDEMFRLRASYEDDFKGVTQFPADWQGERGTVDRYKGHNVAVASAWGLFPASECVYISQAPGLPAGGCFSATYQVPDNDAFWSITVYNGDGYMFSDNNNLNSAAMVPNDDGTVTIHYGNHDACGEDRPNRIDIAQGWNILVRVYRPGPGVIAGDFVLPAIIEASAGARQRCLNTPHGPQRGAERHQSVGWTRPAQLVLRPRPDDLLARRRRDCEQISRAAAPDPAYVRPVSGRCPAHSRRAPERSQRPSWTHSVPWPRCSSPTEFSFGSLRVDVRGPKPRSERGGCCAILQSCTVRHGPQRPRIPTTTTSQRCHRQRWWNQSSTSSKSWRAVERWSSRLGQVASRSRSPSEMSRSSGSNSPGRCSTGCIPNRAAIASGRSWATWQRRTQVAASVWCIWCSTPSRTC